MVELSYWGKLADVTGVASESCTLPGHIADTKALRAWLDRRQGADGIFLDPANRIAINDTIVCEPAPINAGDTVAFLPPVGGG